MFSQFPNLGYQVMTMRVGHSASHNTISACLYNGETLLVRRRYDITDIVDRVGGGDAPTAGLIYGMQTSMSGQDALEIAVAASCLKHSIPGDANLAMVDEIKDLIHGDAAGRQGAALRPSHFACSLNSASSFPPRQFSRRTFVLRPIRSTSYPHISPGPPGQLFAANLYTSVTFCRPLPQ